MLSRVNKLMPTFCKSFICLTTVSFEQEAEYGWLSVKLVAKIHLLSAEFVSEYNGQLILFDVPGTLYTLIYQRSLVM